MQTENLFEMSYFSVTFKLLIAVHKNNSFPMGFFNNREQIAFAALLVYLVIMDAWGFFALFSFYFV